MSMNVTQFVGSDNFNMARFNTMIQQINSGVNSEVSALTDLISSGAKIQTGSYVGTGTYGSSNPCSLTFDFEPKLFVFFATENAIYYYGQNTSSSTVTHIIMLWGTTTAWVSGSGGYRNYITYTSNKISWYNDSSAARQCNESGTTYKYCALG